MLIFPSFLRGPVEAGYSRRETERFTASQPASGAYYYEIVSDDAPMYFTVNFLFERYQAQAFRAWLRQNNFELLTGGQFEIQLSTEDGITTQIAAFTPTGIPQMTGESGRIISYSGEIMVQRFNEPTLGYEDLVLAAAEMGGNKYLDIAITQEMPEL